VWLDVLTRPTKRKCRMEACRVDWDTAEPFAGIGRLLRLALALIWVRAEQGSPRPSDAVLINLRFAPENDEALFYLH
jgi:hypothetical protein